MSKALHEQTYNIANTALVTNLLSNEFWFSRHKIKHLPKSLEFMRAEWIFAHAFMVIDSRFSNILLVKSQGITQSQEVPSPKEHKCLSKWWLKRWPLGLIKHLLEIPEIKHFWAIFTHDLQEMLLNLLGHLTQNKGLFDSDALPQL